MSNAAVWRDAVAESSVLLTVYDGWKYSERGKSIIRGGLGVHADTRRRSLRRVSVDEWYINDLFKICLVL